MQQPWHNLLFDWTRSALRVLAASLLSGTLCSGMDADRWRWSNPLPHGNNAFDMLVTAELAVQVGDAGAVLVRRSDEHWVPASTGITNYLRGVALMGSRILVCGENGMILWSDDGREFHPASVLPSTDAWFESVGANESVAVAVGDFGTIYTSTNGTVWTPVNSGTFEWLRGAAAIGGGFVAVGENGTVLESDTGSDWRPGPTLGVTEHLNRVRRLGNASNPQLVLVGNGGTAFSASGLNSVWSSLDPGTTNDLYDVAMNSYGTLLAGDSDLRFRPNGASLWTPQVVDGDTNSPPSWVYLSAAGAGGWFMAAGRTGLLYNGSVTDGGTVCDWEPDSDSSYAWLWDVTTHDGIYTAVGDLATVLTSLDGIVWAREVVPGNVTNVVLLGVGGDANRLLAVGSEGVVYVSHAGSMELTITNHVGTNLVVTNRQVNTLGLVWTNVPAFCTLDLQGVAAHDGSYLVAGQQGSLYFSADGTNWSSRSTGTANFLSGLAADDGCWIACGANGTLLRAGPDALTWTSVNPTATTAWIYRVRRLQEKWVAVGEQGTVLSSLDGTHWSAADTGTQEWLCDVTFAGGTWYVAGTHGTLLASPNLTDWVRLRLPTIKALFAAAAWDDQLILAGVEGIVLRNRANPTESPVDILDYTLTVATNTISIGTNTVSEVNAYELFLFGGQPDQQYQFQSSASLSGNTWTNRVKLELYDPSGTLYVLRTRARTNTPASEYYRTELVP